MRPNPIALRVVELRKVEGNTLHVVGLDCLDSTPLLDIKPYFASTDAIPDARVGWHADRKADSAREARSGLPRPHEPLAYSDDRWAPYDRASVTVL